jgi:hypothetical protein
MYNSRVEELREERGEYNEVQAIKDYEKCMLGQQTDNMRELNYQDQKAIHNLKYFTWVEQQAKDVKDLNQLWYDREIWHKLFTQVDVWDELIEEFNERTGLLKTL